MEAGGGGPVVPLVWNLAPQSWLNWLLQAGRRSRREVHSRIGAMHAAAVASQARGTQWQRKWRPH